MTDETRYWWIESLGRIELHMTAEQAHSASHPGECEPDVDELLKQPDIAAQLATLPDTLLRDVLREYGAWEDDELQDRYANLQRLVWLAAGDVSDALTEGTAEEAEA